MIERRKSSRLGVVLEVTYRVLKPHKRQKEFTSQVNDIGGGGVQIISKDVMRQGDLVELKMRVPHLANEIMVLGEVVWYRENRDEGETLREAGLRFRDVAQADLHKILEYVHGVGIG